MMHAVTTENAQRELETRLLLLGGGPRPVDAMQWFARAAGGGAGRVLLVAWASQAPFSALSCYRSEMAALGVRCSMSSALPPTTRRDRQRFLRQLARATAVFFTGGDQNRTLDALNDPLLRRALHAAFQRGIVFGGTSAGTAIHSALAIQGDPEAAQAHTPTRMGLGTLAGAVVDQHFLKRGRQARLADVVRRHPHVIGLGIDEEAALLVERGHCATVLGRHHVLLMHQVGGHTASVTLEPGDALDLRSLDVTRAREAFAGAELRVS